MKKEDFPPDLIDGDEAIDLVIDAVLVGSKKLGKLTKGILQAQDRLHRAATPKAWKEYLVLEDLVNERTDVQMQLLVRWALAHGARRRR
jgi:hypothetical protein